MYMGIRGPDGAGEEDLHEGEEPGEHHRMVVRLRSRNIYVYGDKGTRRQEEQERCE